MSKCMEKFTALGFITTSMFLAVSQNALADWTENSFQQHTHQTLYTNLKDVTTRNGWHYFYSLIEIHDGYTWEETKYFSSEIYSKINCKTRGFVNLTISLFKKPNLKGPSVDIEVSDEVLILDKEYFKTHPICKKKF